MKISKRSTIFLDNEQALSVQLVGGKAARLAALLRAGYPVPSGICLTTEVFEHALRPYQPAISTLLQTPALTDIAIAKRVAAQVHELLTNLTLPASVYKTLLAMLPQIAGAETAVVVRSSATDEDSTTASFAGQYATIFCIDKNMLEQAILDCWRSFFSANALAQRAQTDKPDTDASMALLIQPLMDADCSGVAYSIDPVKQNRSQVAINSVWGLGPGVVDGTVPTDTDWVERDNWHIEKRQIVPKREQIKLDAAGQLQRMPVPDNHIRSACLPDSWLKRIAQFAISLEQFFGYPQDIEWALVNEQIMILQSRPLTSHPSEQHRISPFPISWQNDDQAYCWERSHYEAYQQDVPYPLEYDHFVVQESIREETCRLMGVERDEIMQRFNGRPYYRKVPIEWTEADRRLRHQALNDQHDRLFQEGRTTWDVWGSEIVQATERLRAFDFIHADGLALADHLQNALAAQRRHAMLHPLCAWRPRAAYYAAYTAVTGQSGPDADAAAIQLLDGADTPLTQLIDTLYALGRTAQTHPVLSELLANPPTGSINKLLKRLDALEADTAVTAFRQQFLDIIANYGERVGHGYGSQTTVRTPTWAEQPAQFLRLAAIYFDPARPAPAELRAKSQKERDEVVAALCAACDDPQAVTDFKRLWRNGRRWWTVLETHNHYIDQMTCGQLHHAVMAAARWLVAQNRLHTVEAVFWLTFAEIDAALCAQNPLDFSTEINARQTQHAAWSKLKAPSILGIPRAKLPARPPFSDDVTPPATAVDPTSIQGVGASAGQVTGHACVIQQESDWHRVAAGDIVVAHNIGPQWTPLFPLLGGLVLESGSIGQHAAATAREYGVTAVIATNSATQHIPDGATIFVDGTNGIIKLQ